MTPNDRFSTKTLRLDAVFKWIGRLFMKNIASAHVSQHRKVLRNLSKIISLPKKSGIPKLAFLIGTLALVPALSVASPATSNEASIDILSTITSATVTVNEGGSGCSSGRQWDVIIGGCTAPVLISSSSYTETRIRSCPSGQLGSVTEARTVTINNFGWRIPPSGSHVINHSTNSPGGWYQISNSCYTPAPPGPPPPPPASVGAVFTISAMVCDSSNPGYYYGAAPAPNYWNRIISAYRGFNSGGRCPDVGGYHYWIGDILKWGGTFLAESGVPASPCGAACMDQYERAWAVIRSAMSSQANVNGESGPNGIVIANKECQMAANALFGYGSTTATYNMYSGNKCTVTSLR